MPKIVKAKPHPHVVIVDTNILWNEEKGPPVAPAFDTFWAAQAGTFELELVVPGVVRGELLFQQTSSAHKALERVDQGCSDLSTITAHLHLHRFDKDGVAQRVEKKLDKWISQKGAIVHPTPVSTINWTQLCDAAVWRQPPFTADSKNPKNEKGFRDALILETVCDFVRGKSGPERIAFLCNDHLLRSTTVDALRSEARFSCYASLDEFTSYLLLTKETLDDEFIKAILKRASEKFYTSDDRSTLLYKEQIHVKATELCKELLASPEAATGGPWSFGLTTWEGVGKGQWIVAATEFDSLRGDREYHWKTPLVLKRGYVGKSSFSFNAGTPEQKLLLVTVVARWKAKVKNDARFHNVAFEKIEISGSSFRDPTDDERKEFLTTPMTPSS